MVSPTSPIDKTSMHRYCFYYLQGVNGESFSSPNAFMIKDLQPNSRVTFGTVKRSFPFKNMFESI